MSQIIIREFKKEDLVKAGNVVKRSMKPSLKDLTREETEGILSRYSPENFREKLSKGTYFVAEKTNTGNILGVIGLHDNEVKTFYVDPKHQGKGIGKLLFNRLMHEASKKGLTKLITKSSPIAEPVYKGLGFKPVRKEWKEAGGRKFYNVWMERVIKS